MIVDYGAFMPNNFRQQSGLLTVLQQHMAMVLMEDKTSEIYNNIYWARYNILSFKAMFSGLPSPMALYEDCLSYTQNHMPASSRATTPLCVTCSPCSGS